MKKFLAIIASVLCLVFTFTFVACASGNNNSNNNDNQNNNQAEGSQPDSDGSADEKDEDKDSEESEVPPVYVADIPELTENPQPLPAPAGEATASLTFAINTAQTAYSVTGMEKTDETAAIVIPAEHGGLPVTTIAESAFAYSRHTADISSVVIPDSVTTIERNAFYSRSEMTNVYISADSKLETIGNNAFSGNNSLEFIYIPSGVEEIGDSAFNNCGAIDFAVSAQNDKYRSDNGHLIETEKRTLIRGGQSGEIPDWVTTVSPAAFRKANVTELTIPNSVTTIGNYFIANSTITSIVYIGVEAQWNAIEKSATMWNSGNKDVEVKYQAQTKILVVYFSATNNTERVAGYIADVADADTFELVPVNPYSSADLTWTNQNSRVVKEHNDPTLQNNIELVSTTVENWASYDTVFIGYPIWWGIASWVVNGFVINNDFTGKTVIPFATSSSSGLGQSGTLLAEMAGTGDWQTGMRFSSSVSQATVTNWVNGLNLI